MLTKGGPGTATQTLNIYSFYTGFNWLHLGYVAAIATTMLVIILCFVLALVKISRTSLTEID
jgi:multiple sugar transport system permease protein